MASIKCRHGGVEHRHDSVQAVKECIGLVAAHIDEAQRFHSEDPGCAERCPRCDSHRPELHPAVQHGGEVSVCTDPWHASTQTARGVLARLGLVAAMRPADLGDLTPIETEADEADVETWKKLDPSKAPEPSAAVLAAKQAAKDDPRPDRPGIYLKDGIYYKVQKARNSEHLYAKRGYLEETPVYSGDAGDVSTHKWTWEYVKGAVTGLRQSQLLTQEQASEFGKLWSICVNCFRELTHEESMERGYGPRCADNNGWEYNHHRKG